MKDALNNGTPVVHIEGGGRSTAQRDQAKGSPKMSKINGVMHDFTNKQKRFGWDVAFNPKDGGLQAAITGWSDKVVINAGDYLLLSNGEATTRYRITSIRYYSDPSDMFRAEAEFAPRQSYLSKAN